jgi:hypothetical protein
VERSEAIRNGTVTPQQDNMLAVTGDGRKAALDMRLVDPFAEDYEGSKTNQCAEKVFGVWKGNRINQRHTDRILRFEHPPLKRGDSASTRT